MAAERTPQSLRMSTAVAQVLCGLIDYWHVSKIIHTTPMPIEAVEKFSVRKDMLKELIGDGIEAVMVETGQKK